MYGDVTEEELVHLPVLIERVNNEIKALTHSLTHSHSLNYLLTYLLTHYFTHFFAHSFSLILTHSLAITHSYRI